MIVVRLKGGLGNQMFQYAFAKATAQKLNTDFKLDCSLLLDRSRQEQVVFRDYDLDIFNLDDSFVLQPDILKKVYLFKYSSIGKFFRKRAEKSLKYIKEPHFHVDESILNKPFDQSLYDGWWQSERYFSEIREKLKNDFALQQPLQERSQELLRTILKSNAVCLNVRRTDFINNPTLNATNLQYFQKGIEFLRSKINEPHFYVFSDDIKWCEENLGSIPDCTIVSHEHKGYKFSTYLRLMSQCTHFIIPNSSFAWWAVWLSNQENHYVIAPKNWFNDLSINTDDLVPIEWVRI